MEKQNQGGGSEGPIAPDLRPLKKPYTFE